MRILFVLLLSLFINSTFGSEGPKRVHKKKVEGKRFVTTRIGSIKDGGTFSSTDGCSQVNLTTDCYSNTRQLGQLGIGDILYQSNGTTPINGQSHWWGFNATNGGNAIRSVQIDGSGVITNVTSCVTRVTTAFNSTTHTSNCANANYVEGLYTAPDDLTMYNGKLVYISAGGATLGAGSYTASYIANGIALWKFDVSGSSSQVSNLTYCITHPVANAGPDANYSLPSPSVTLSGSGIDPDNEPFTYAWTQQSGPNTATITSPTSASTTVTGVVAGVYVFRLTLTDDAESGFDDVSITIVPAPLCATPTKFNIKPYMIWGPNGEYGYASQQSWDTITKKNPWTLGAAFVNFDMDFDPRNNQFDANLAQAGFQRDSTTPMMTRASIHDYWQLGNGTERVVVCDWGKVMYWEELWYYDTTQVAFSDAVEIVIGDLDEARKAVFEYRPDVSAPTIDYLVSSHTTAGWYKIGNMRDTGQYMVIRYKKVNNSPEQGVNFSSWVPYGCQSPFGTADTRITPDFAAGITRDTTYPGNKHAHVVVATPIPGSPPTYWRDTMKYVPAIGGYILAFDTAKANSGFLDTANIGHFDISNPAFTYYVAPYNSNTIFGTDDSAFNVVGGINNDVYQVIGSPSRRLLKEIVATGNSANQHIPLDSLTADRRYQTSYGRFVWTFLMSEAIFNTAPDTTTSIGQYIKKERISANPYPGRPLPWYTTGSGLRKKRVIPYNENAADFRPGSVPQGSYMSPVALWAFHDTLYQAFHIVFPSAKMTLQGFPAWMIEPFIEAEFLGRLFYKDKNHPICDVINMHTTISTYIFDMDKGCPQNTDQQGIFPGIRGETQKAQDFLDTMAYVSGRWRNMVVTEYSYGSNKNYLKPNGCDFISGLSARQIKTYQPHESQGIMRLHAKVAYERVRGMEATYEYESFDAADTTSIFYNNIDDNNGNVNGFNHWYKAGYFITQEHNKWMNDYRVWSTVCDTLSGNLTVLYRNVNSTKRDSFCLLTFWQNYSDAPANRVFTLAPDVSAVTRLRHLWPDFTFNGTTVATTVTAGTVTFTPRPEGDYIFFKSPVLSTSLDTPTNPTMKLRAKKDQGIFQGP